MSAEITADRSGTAGPYWAAMDEGRLTFQRCGRCGDAQLPAAGHCRACLSDDLRWEDASGKAHLVSWVVYHRAYHDAMAEELPYNVAVVELAEGPRMITNIRAPSDSLAIGMRLAFVPGERFGQAIAQFQPESD